MTAILDFIVPARRREKEIKDKAFREQLNQRWGDTSITPPMQGAWNSPDSGVYNVGKDDKEYGPGFVPGYGMYHGEKTAAKTSLDMPNNDSHSVHERRQHNTKNLTIQLSIPWPSASRRRLIRSNSLPKDQKSPAFSTQKPLQHSPTSPNTLVNSTATATTALSAEAPSVRYKPISSEYRKDLANSVTEPTISPSSATTTCSESSPVTPPQRDISSSVVVYKPASDAFLKEMAQVGMTPSPGIPPEQFGQLYTVVKQLPAGPPKALTNSPDLQPNSTAPSPKIRQQQQRASISSESSHSSRTHASPPLPNTQFFNSPALNSTGLNDSDSVKSDRHLRKRSPSVPTTIQRNSTTPSIPPSTSQQLQPMPSNNPSTQGGYYASLANEYRAIAKGVSALSNDTDTDSGPNPNAPRKRDESRRRARSHSRIRRGRSVSQNRARTPMPPEGEDEEVGPQELVPRRRELYG